MLKQILITTILLVGLVACGAQDPLYYAVGGPQWDKAGEKGNAAQDKARKKTEDAMNKAIDKINALVIKALKMKWGTYLVLFKNQDILDVINSFLENLDGYLEGAKSFPDALATAQKAMAGGLDQPYKVYDANGDKVFDSSTDAIDPNMQDKIDSILNDFQSKI